MRMEEVKKANNQVKIQKGSSGVCRSGGAPVWNKNRRTAGECPVSFI